MRPAPFKPVELSPIDLKKWQDTLAAMSWIAPGFVHIIYTMLNNTGNKNIALFTEDIHSTAATDGFQMIFKPSMFFKYSLLERVFGGIHEVSHEMLNHCRLAHAFQQAGKITLNGKSLPWSSDFANIIQDLVINDTLIASKIGTFNKDWLHDPSIASQNDDWMTAYFRNWKNPPPPMCGLPGGPGQGGKGGDKDNKDGKGGQGDDPSKPLPKGRFDYHLAPHQSTGKEKHEVPARQDAQWGLAVKAAMEIQRSQGKLPAALEKFFTEILKPRVTWEEHITGMVMRIIGSGAYDWRTLDRRLITRGIGAPGLTGRTAELIVVGADSSGSIYGCPSTLNVFFGEMSGIAEDCNPREVHVVWCDAKVQRVDIIHDMADLKNMFFKGAKGGGGTDFRPVFDYVAKNGLEPDMLVYLTDGYGTFPAHEPEYPVIWASTTDTKYPFGQVVRVPVQED